MKKRKKIFRAALLTCVVLTGILYGCGKEENPETDSVQQQETAALDEPLEEAREMSEVNYDGEHFIVVPFGTDKTNIPFDGALSFLYGDMECTEAGAEWSCEEYSSDKPGVYVFRPVLPSRYNPLNEPELPKIEVAVAEAGGIEIESIDTGALPQTSIPVGVTALNVPEKARITYTCAGEKRSAEISVSYNTKSYAPVKGEYVIPIETVQEPFRLSEKTVGSSEIRVRVTEIFYARSGDVFTFQNADIRVLAQKRGAYTITDAAGLYTYYEDVGTIYAMELGGEDPGLTIASPLVYVESDITFQNVQGNAEADVAKSLVTKIRTDCPENVTVNGILLDTFSGKTSTEISGGMRGSFYFNGIPGILARGEDGGTYAYRSYDGKKLSETNLAGWDVSGGAVRADSETEVTNVRFESGTVYRLFAAGKGVTQDATLVLDGGAVAWASYGGAMKGGSVLKATVVYESGDSKRRAYLGGEEDTVLGDPDKEYGEGEYSAEVWYFDCSIQYVTLGGNRGEIYGNIRYEQYGGRLLELYTGGYMAPHYGDVDINVYGGLWEKLFRQQTTHKGNARLKLYEGIQREEFIQYPDFEKLNAKEYTQEVEYFSYPDNFRFIEYEDRRAEVTDISQDAGQLIIRFLETRVDDKFEKGTVKIRQKTGDSNYIVFPDGRNMLIDTGTQIGASCIVQDLKDLGVTKLDYLMITHNHTDHAGGLRDICKAFDVGTFLYQKYVTPSAELKKAVDSEEAEVIYLGAGDTLDIGEVHFDVIGPDEKLVSAYNDPNNGSIAVVMTYGESKAYLGGDSLAENEAAWLAQDETVKLLSDCQLVKLNHHGIFNANTPEFLDVVNADKYVITQMREYGTQLGQAMAQLQGGFGVLLDDIYSTGRNGMVKAVLEKDGTLKMSCQYVKTTPYYADYSQLDALFAGMDESKLSGEAAGLWAKACGRIKRDFLYEEQNIVDGLCVYLSDVMKFISGQ